MKEKTATTQLYVTPTYIQSYDVYALACVGGWHFKEEVYIRIFGYLYVATTKGVLIDVKCLSLRHASFVCV